ncbi:MAG: thioredoxin family protein [Ignavibacteriales bacterium]|nr:thioredoxin family protein [Ignavibacteriales bacterium]
MSPFLIVLVVLLGLFVFFQIGFYIKSKKTVGQQIPFDKIESEFLDKIKDKKGFVYFHSPTCHNCKNQTPIVEKLKEKFSSIISIDVSKNLQTARALNVMGTPSIVFFGGNEIKGYYVGVKDENFLIEKMNNL